MYIKIMMSLASVDNYTITTGINFNELYSIYIATVLSYVAAWPRYTYTYFTTLTLADI